MGMLAGFFQGAATQTLNHFDTVDAQLEAEAKRAFEERMVKIRADAEVNAYRDKQTIDINNTSRKAVAENEAANLVHEDQLGRGRDIAEMQAGVNSDAKLADLENAELFADKNFENQLNRALKQKRAELKLEDEFLEKFSYKQLDNGQLLQVNSKTGEQKIIGDKDNVDWLEIGMVDNNGVDREIKVQTINGMVVVDEKGNPVTIGDPTRKFKPSDESGTGNGTLTGLQLLNEIQELRNNTIIQDGVDQLRAAERVLSEKPDDEEAQVMYAQAEQALQRELDLRIRDAETAGEKELADRMRIAWRELKTGDNSLTAGLDEDGNPLPQQTEQPAPSQSPQQPATAQKGGTTTYYGEKMDSARDSALLSKYGIKTPSQVKSDEVNSRSQYRQDRGIGDQPIRDWWHNFSLQKQQGRVSYRHENIVNGANRFESNLKDGKQVSLDDALSAAVNDSSSFDGEVREVAKAYLRSVLQDRTVDEKTKETIRNVMGGNI